MKGCKKLLNWEGAEEETGSKSALAEAGGGVGGVIVSPLVTARDDMAICCIFLKIIQCTNGLETAEI